MTCSDKCIHYSVCEQKKYDFANIEECPYYYGTTSDIPNKWQTAYIDNAPTAPQVEPTYVSDMPDDKVKDLQTLAIDYGEGIAVFERKRPRGEWKETDIPESIFCKCSVCGFDLGAYSFNFCPNCGADMRGDSDYGR